MSDVAGAEGALLDARFEFAEALIEEASALALGHFMRLDALTIRGKGAQDMVSQADLEVELLIRSRLGERFPGDGFLGEETGRSDVEGARGIWVVDPIDGTQPFVSGMSSWCVSIGYIRDGVIELGLVTAPARDEAFAGRRGVGATLNGRPIAVSRSTSLAEGMTGTGYSPRIGPDQLLPIMEPLLRQGGMFYRDGSGALMLCYVACGRLIGYVEAHINAWDCAAALAVVEAAGGRTNDYLTDDALWRGNRIAAGPPALYPALEALLGPTGQTHPASPLDDARRSGVGPAHGASDANPPRRAG